MARARCPGVSVLEEEGGSGRPPVRTPGPQRGVGRGAVPAPSRGVPRAEGRAPANLLRSGLARGPGMDGHSVPRAALAEAPRGGQQAVVPVSVSPGHAHPGQDQALPGDRWLAVAGTLSRKTCGEAALEEGHIPAGPREQGPAPLGQSGGLPGGGSLPAGPGSKLGPPWLLQPAVCLFSKELWGSSPEGTRLQGCFPDESISTITQGCGRFVPVCVSTVSPV